MAVGSVPRNSPPVSLQAWRVRWGGPKFVKLGRCVRYTERDLEEFIAQKTLTHTLPADLTQHTAALER